VIPYLVRRILVFIPTFFGVSFAIWLVMTLAPGEATRTQSTGGLGGETPENLQDLEAQNRNERFFRRQFNLDRPRFWNGWASLEEDEVRGALETLAAGPGEKGAGAVKKAKRRLEDWGSYAVPVLVGLLPRVEGKVQDLALSYLRLSAYTFRAQYPTGHQPTEEERERDREVDRENAVVNGPEYFWPEGAPPERRREVAGAWARWYEERRARFEHDFGERVWIGLTDTQFAKYWANIFALDMGQSSRTEEPVLGMIASRLKYSLTIFVPAFLIGWLLSVFLGVSAAARHGGAYDQAVGLTVFALYSIPSMVAATVLQQWLAVELGWFPTDRFDSGPDAKGMNTWEYLGDVAWHVTLPIACYAYGILAYISRQARSSVLDVLRSDYVRTARAKGLRERTVVWVHAARNGMIPLVTLLGTALPVLIGGSPIIEHVFSIDGFGRLLITSIYERDYNAVMGIELVVAFLTLVGILLTDILYAAVDPRIALK
jgi:peptide/nickel transport system permease protein